MKKLTKLLSIALAGVMCFSMAGCGGSVGSSEGTTEGTTGEAVASADGGIELSQEGKLIWGTNAEFAPYEYMEGSEVVGIDAEIADALAEKLGLTAQVENMAFNAIVPAVTTGKVDIGLAGMTADEERKKNVNFSEPYVEAGQVIVVNKDSDIKSVADLSGKIVGVQNGTTGDEYVSDEENGVGVASVERFSSGPEAAQSLATGKIDAVVIDNEPAKAIVANNADLIVLEEPLTSEQYAIAVSKDKPALLEAINGALNEMKESGELQTILDKYLNDTDSSEAAAEETTAE